jgi:hypothetical protein
MKGEQGKFAGVNIMARYVEAIQSLNLIAPERLPEALAVADARAGLRSVQGCDSALLEIVFSVPDEQFRWFRLVLRKMSERYERNKPGGSGPYLAAVLPWLALLVVDSPC